MKNLKTIILGIVLVSGVAIAAVSFAYSGQNQDNHAFGKHRHHKGFALALLTRYQVENLAVQSLSELSGQSVEVIKQKFENQRPRAVMRELGIDRDAFRDAMQVKIRDLIRQARANGSITSQQEEEIIAKMEQQNQRRMLMKQLIEKGVTDGTITGDQAIMLQRRPK